MGIENRGRYFVIEGTVGCGKTTVIERLKKDYPRIMFVREPGGTPFAEKIRDAVQGLNGYSVDPYASYFGYTSQRADLIRGKVIPALESGEDVLSDRNWISSLAYQANESVSRLVIMLTSLIATRGLRPDLLIYYDLDPKIGLQRKGKNLDRDRYDVKDLLYHNGVRKRYHEIEKFGGHVFVKKWVTIDASRSKEEVYQNTLEVLDKAALKIN